MAFDKNRIIEYFDLKPFGRKGWYRSDELVCPQCSQNDEFAVLFTKDGGIVHCLHTRTCNGYKTSLYNYLKLIGKFNLVDFEKSINFDEFPDFSEKKEEKVDVLEELSLKKLPLGFKRVDFDEYLDSRNFLPEHYELFKVGICNIDSRYKVHLIFQILNENEQCVGWLARSRNDKKWHEDNLKKFKGGNGNLILRYDNSPETDFGRMLGGYNEITENTKSIILVEGLFDKVNVDSRLALLKQEEYKCLFSFGNTLTDEQIDLLKSDKCKNVKYVFMLYDEGTIKNSKEYGNKLISTKKNIMVCEIKKKDLDPGEMNYDELIETLEKSVDAFSFNFNKVDGI